MVRLSYQRETMTPQDLIQHVCEVLAEVQELGGYPAPTLTVESTPIGDLPGFDSLSSIEATVLLEQKLGRDLDSESVFISEDGKHALNVNQIADRLCDLLGVERVGS
jgi:acyl carrier protein